MFLLTGASSPLGASLAADLLSSGFRCILVVRSKREFEWLEGFHPSLYKLFECDLSRDVEVSKLCKFISGLAAQITSFVHLASRADEEKFEIRSITKTFTVNVFSAWKIAACCLPLMKAAGGGRIVFVGSVGHKFGGKNDEIGYAASKITLEYFPRQFRECAVDNILINTLRVGVMDGGKRFRDWRDDRALAERIDLIPTKAAIRHDEVINNIRLLCSYDNRSIHNAIIECTGGE